VATAYDVLRRFLSDRLIAFHPELARAFGGITVTTSSRSRPRAGCHGGQPAAT